MHGRSADPDVVESDAGEFTTPTESVKPDAEIGEDLVATSLCSLIALISAFPSAVWRVGSLWLAKHILECGLQNK